VKPRLIVITDTARGSFDVWLAQLERLLAGAVPGAVLVMLRDRQLPIRERRALGERLRELTARHAQAFGVNDRLDLAVLLGAEAVHLAESSVSVADARAFAGAQARSWWISRACHDIADVRTSDADALLIAPVAEPRKGRPALGTDGVRRARSEIERRAPDAERCRIYALGGVNAANAATLIGAGADGIALIGALFEPDAPRVLVESLGVRR
jgi:thiamine-phosphate pyrophosphorylase